MKVVYLAAGRVCGCVYIDCGPVSSGRVVGTRKRRESGKHERTRRKALFDVRTSPVTRDGERGDEEKE